MAVCVCARRWRWTIIKYSMIAAHYSVSIISELAADDVLSFESVSVCMYVCVFVLLDVSVVASVIGY